MSAPHPAIPTSGVGPRRVTAGVTNGLLQVVDFAAAEAARRSAELVLLHSYVVPLSATEGFYEVEVVRSFEQAGRAVLDGARQHLSAWRPGVRVRTLLRQDSPAASLDDASRDTDLLVIGSDHDKPWPVVLAEGHVTRRVVESASCPVVVVPDRWSETDDREDVVVLLDTQTPADGPLRFAFEMAASRNSRLEMLHVAPAYDGEYGLERRRAVMEQLRERWVRRFPGIDAEVSVLTGEPGVTARRTSVGAGLLVMGRRHDTGRMHPWGVSLAQEVAASSSCALAVVPAEYEGTYRPFSGTRVHEHEGGRPYPDQPAGGNVMTRRPPGGSP